ncbi:MAG: hypothetical protein ACM3SY_10170 [Candidatus Omnitrophota bacterium]
MNEDNAHVHLKVNGIEIPLNAFVTRVFFHVINGLVDSLDKIPDEKKKIEITID